MDVDLTESSRRVLDARQGRRGKLAGPRHASRQQRQNGSFQRVERGDGDGGDAGGQAAHGRDLPLGVEPLASYGGPELLVEARDHLVGRRCRHHRWLHGWLKQGHGDSPEIGLLWLRAP